MPQNASVRTILAADIGGTSSRFALFTLNLAAKTPEEGLALVRRVRFPTADSRDTADMMRILATLPGEDGGYFTPASPEPVHVDAAVFGIPGPTTVADPTAPPFPDEVCFCPNITWPMEAASITAALEGAPVRLINDFVANGFACALLPRLIDAVSVLEGEGKPGFPSAVVGGGTGLGHCLVLPGDPPIVLGSEGGHAAFAFTSEEEDIARCMAAASGGRSTGDTTVTGSGLARLYACCTGESLHPHDVPPLAVEHPEVLALAARFYGRAVCHYMVITLALGGVFITGGLAANMPQVLTHPEFAAEIRERSPMSRVLQNVPVRHVRNQTAGLWGAAACAALWFA